MLQAYNQTPMQKQLIITSKVLATSQLLDSPKPSTPFLNQKLSERGLMKPGNKFTKVEMTPFLRRME